jgi:hypothetical protein
MYVVRFNLDREVWYAKLDADLDGLWLCITQSLDRATKRKSVEAAERVLRDYDENLIARAEIVQI